MGFSCYCAFIVLIPTLLLFLSVLQIPAHFLLVMQASSSNPAPQTLVDFGYIPLVVLPCYVSFLQLYPQYLPHIHPCFPQHILENGFVLLVLHLHLSIVFVLIIVSSN